MTYATRFSKSYVLHAKRPGTNADWTAHLIGPSENRNLGEVAFGHEDQKAKREAEIRARAYFQQLDIPEKPMDRIIWVLVEAD
jgi:hypothetical protein